MKKGAHIYAIAVLIFALLIGCKDDATLHPTNKQADLLDLPAFSLVWNTRVREYLTTELRQLQATPSPTAYTQHLLRSTQSRLAQGDFLSFAPAGSLPQDITWQQEDATTPALGDPRARKGGHVHLWNRAPFPITLRPVGPNSTSFFRYSLYDNIDLPLVSQHPTTQQIIAGLASRWAVAQDGKTVYFQIDPRAKYSNGESVHAQDFALFLALSCSDVAQDPFYAELFASQLAHVRVHAKENVLEVSLPWVRPLAPLLIARLLKPACPSFYAGITRSYLADYQWRVPPTTGSYTVQAQDIKRGHSITLRRVHNWWGVCLPAYRHRFNADSVTHHFMADEGKALELLRKGNIHAISVQNPTQWNHYLNFPEIAQGKLTPHLLPLQLPHPPYGIYINTATPPWHSLPARRGLLHALNMPAAIANAFQGEMSPLCSYTDGYPTLTITPVTQYPYSPTQARALFAQAGYSHTAPDGILTTSQGERLVLVLSYADASPTLQALLEKLQADALACGLEIKLEPLDSASCSRKVYDKKHAAALWAWPLATPFPELIHTFYSHLGRDHTGKPISGTDNLFSIADKELDDAICAEATAPDLPTLTHAVHASQNRIAQLAIWVPGWKDTHSRLLTTPHLHWPATPDCHICYPAWHDPLESHLFWVE